MITCVSLNTAIDQVYVTSTLQASHIHRVDVRYRFAGGKAINVAKVLHQFNVPVQVIGFCAGVTGMLIQQFITSLHIPHTWINVDGESRYCTTIVTNEGTTELLEQGHTVTWQHIEQLVAACLQQAAASTFFVLSGSLPQGMTMEQYAYVIKRLQETDVHVVVDTSGEALAYAYTQQPFLMKPNESEFAQLIGYTPPSLHAYAVAIQQLQHRPPFFIVSLGKQGALVAAYDTIMYATAPPMTSLHAVGSGDSFLAGFLAALHRTQPLEEAVKMAMAAGRANAHVYEVAHLERAIFEQQLPHVKLRNLEG